MLLWSEPQHVAAQAHAEDRRVDVRNMDIRPLHRWSLLGGLIVVYFLAGKLGLQFAFLHSSATAVWPPTGIALAAVLLFGNRVAPAIFIGAFLVNITTAA